MNAGLTQLLFLPPIEARAASTTVHPGNPWTVHTLWAFYGCAHVCVDP